MRQFSQTKGDHILRTMAIYLVTAVCVLGGFYCTLVNQSYWPLCNYNMFSSIPSDRTAAIEVSLSDMADGHVIVDPGNLFPVEFFRARGFMWSVLTGEDKAIKNRFCAAILDFINQRKWRAFDEIMAHPSYVSAAGNRQWRKMEVYLVKYRMSKVEGQMTTLSRELLYSYQI
jgi:hypothetical protein